MRDAISNLFLNAQNAAKSLSRPLRLVVDTEISAEGDMLQLRILDNAGGLPADIMSDPFGRYHGRRNAEAESNSSGIGLWIVRQIIRQHDGKIGVRNTEVLGDSGTEFHIQLPVVRKGARHGNSAGRG